MSIASDGVTKSQLSWASEPSNNLAPVIFAKRATCPLVKQCPFRALISTKTPFVAADCASSELSNPGWARISTSGDWTAARLVPFSTGSTMVSPWTTTICAPSSLARFAAPAMARGGRWVSSTPGMAIIPQCSLATRQSWLTSWITLSREPKPTWSVKAMAL